MGTVATYQRTRQRWYFPYTMEQEVWVPSRGCIEIDAVVLDLRSYQGKDSVYLVRLGYNSSKDNIWVYSWSGGDSLGWRLIRACLQGAFCELSMPWCRGGNLDRRSVTIRMEPVGAAWRIVDFLPCMEPKDMQFPLLLEELYDS